MRLPPKHSLERALAEAKRQAVESGQPRYIHHNAIGDLVVLPYRSYACVAEVRP